MPPPASPAKRARTTKSPLETVLGTSKKTAGPRKRVEDDPENIEIMRLRCENRMTWLAIANHLNAQRALHGLPNTLTEPAVYSRFVRNSPRIAIANGEVGFDPKDFMHLRHPHYYPNQRLETGGHASIPKDIKNNYRPRMGKIDENAALKECEELQSRERTEMLLRAAGRVEREFWGYVADELERECGTLYHAKVLESVYRGAMK
ncbi:hypothetical protein K491DRAFT_593447 [Lophiostoma macrostomum CBS 122681]|uniref:Uncharacterized protein n=1 Tax=Lophiostoma macrostomum CBS 122681 TaxID=1314788 RepID=A0A6A6THQ5_9PLEO|nr:hypothetical protein K491DRAFT_593447 [Lophiostoma macrostomum CBS 122681]